MELQLLIHFLAAPPAHASQMKLVIAIVNNNCLELQKPNECSTTATLLAGNGRLLFRHHYIDGYTTVRKCNGMAMRGRRRRRKCHFTGC